MPDLPCKDCGLPVPLGRSDCPHCGRPSLFPNVQAAELGDEQKTLAARYRAAVDAAESRRCGDVLRLFEKAAGTTRAVIARSALEVERLASSPRQLYGTYYQLVGAELKLPDDDESDALRRVADEKLFPGYKERIRFAALSLDGAGLPGYGECSLVLREDRTAHRSSVFEGNSALLLRKWDYNVPAGYRSTWGQRALLCVAKLAGRLRPETKEDEFAGILLHTGATRAEDDFVEVHVCGPLSSGSFERVVLTPPKGTSRRQVMSMTRNLRTKLAKVGLDLETR